MQARRESERQFEEERELADRHERWDDALGNGGGAAGNGNGSLARAARTEERRSRSLNHASLAAPRGSAFRRGMSSPAVVGPPSLCRHNRGPSTPVPPQPRQHRRIASPARDGRRDPGGDGARRELRRATAALVFGLVLEVAATLWALAQAVSAGAFEDPDCNNEAYLSSYLNQELPTSCEPVEFSDVSVLVELPTTRNSTDDVIQYTLTFSPWTTWDRPAVTIFRVQLRHCVPVRRGLISRRTLIRREIVSGPKSSGPRTRCALQRR